MRSSHAIAALDLGMERLAKWSAGCGCHGDHAIAFSEAWKDAAWPPAAEALLALLVNSPLWSQSRRAALWQGRRAPELASGQVQGVIASIFAEGLHHILAQMDGTRTQELAELLHAFEVAKSEMIGVLSHEVWISGIGGHGHWLELPATDPQKAKVLHEEKPVS